MLAASAINGAKTDTQADYLGVSQQSGIFTRDGGFDIEVKGNTDLLGALIASEATRDKNKLTTATFSHANITNVSEAESTTKSYGLDSQVFSGNLYPLAKAAITNAVGNHGSDANHHETSQTVSAIADGVLSASDAASQARLDNISHDTANTHQYIAPANIDEMMADAKAQQFIKDATVDTLFKYSDEAHKRMFIEEAVLYSVSKNEAGELVYTKVPDKDKGHLLTQKDNRVHVFLHGIFNDEAAAAKYSVQNSSNTKLKETAGKEEQQYFVAFPEANNFISEMLIASYQKFLEGDTLGLTNATQVAVELIKNYGESGLQMDGHSRGTLTITNAYSSLLNDSNNIGAYSNLRTNMVGPAANVKNADAKLAQLQGRDSILVIDPMSPEGSIYRPTTEQEKSEMSIHYQAHIADPVSGIGMNSSTGGTAPKGNILGVIWEAGRALGGQNTSHNCYGFAPEACSPLWQDQGGRAIWEPIYKPKNNISNDFDAQKEGFQP